MSSQLSVPTRGQRARWRARAENGHQECSLLGRRPIAIAAVAPLEMVHRSVDDPDVSLSDSISAAGL